MVHDRRRLRVRPAARRRRDQAGRRRRAAPWSARCATRSAFGGDFSPFLLQAQSSGADVIALGSTGSDLINILKAAREFNIGADGKQQLATFTLTVPDIAALGLPAAQGVLVNEAFYWDLDDGTRAFSRRFMDRHHAAPSVIQAGVYSVVLHYLKSVAAAGTTDTDAVMRKMHELPIDDPTVHHASLRPDGRMVHDSYLFRVKSPAESKGPYDFYNLVATIPAAEAFRPLSESACPALKH